VADADRVGARAGAVEGRAGGGEASGAWVALATGWDVIAGVRTEADGAAVTALDPKRISSVILDVTDAGHMVAGDQNDIFSKAVIDFLAGVKPI